MTQFHFISGMPRAGSTLLAAILRQNPDLHASITSPLAALYERVHQSMGARSDYADLISTHQRTAILRGLFHSYYEPYPNSVVFDTNRSWCARLAALNLLFSQGKIIACVRDPAWVLDSFERLHQQNPLLMSKLFGNETHTLHQRLEALAAASGTVGFAYDAVAEAYYGPYQQNLVVVDYEDLCKQPAATLDRIYAALGLAPFKHRFEDIEQINELELFDRRFGLPGLHTIRNKVEWTERKTILPPDLFSRFANKSFWRG